MKARASHGSSTFAILVALASIAGCGGGSKPAESAGNCPEGTVLKGADCLPAASAAGSPKDDDDSEPHKTSTSDDATPPSSAGGGSGGDESGASGASGASGKTPYDKDAVGVELRRAARQVKGNCGAATDENGAANGPWGTLKASIVLGRNGHVRQITIPPEFDGKPVGDCVVHAFQKIVFPPYAASSDATIDYALEIKKPRK